MVLEVFSCRLFWRLFTADGNRWWDGSEGLHGIMADPLSFTRRQTEFLFNGQRKLDDILDCLGATDLNSNGFYSTTKASPSPIIVPSNYESHTEGGRS